jgi:hypothetical protein
MSKRVEPSTKESAFNCPHCGALAAQGWYSVMADKVSAKVPFIAPPDILDRIAANKDLDAETKAKWKQHFERALLGDVFFRREDDGKYLYDSVTNLHLSECFNCHGFSIWLHDRIIYPSMRAGVEPNDDLDADIKRDFEEARSILDQSPRGAAALLRLALQKLCKQLGESGDNIDKRHCQPRRQGLECHDSEGARRGARRRQ